MGKLEKVFESLPLPKFIREKISKLFAIKFESDTPFPHVIMITRKNKNHYLTLEFDKNKTLRVKTITFLIIWSNAKNSENENSAKFVNIDMEKLKNSQEILLEIPTKLNNPIISSIEIYQTSLVKNP